jgi:hypothetical protein
MKIPGRKAAATPHAVAAPMRAPRARLQRATCTCGRPIVAGGECAECRRQRLQRSAKEAAPQALPATVRQTLNTPGRPLEPVVLREMESRFGHDFSRVRIHDGPAAAQSARAVSARAYTVGPQVVFGDEGYRPHTPSGRALLAHELAHTVQQSGLQRASSNDGSELNLAQDAGYARLEREAETAARAALRGETVQLTPGSAGGPTLARHNGTAPPAAAATPATLTSALGTHEVTPDSAMGATGSAATGPRQRRYRVDKFYLPGAKGQRALQLHQSRAGAQQLRTVVQIEGTSARRTAQWQQRDTTATLGDTWVRAVRWPGAERNDRWGALANGESFPRARGQTCNIDHIVELQSGAGNDPENLQALDPDPNQRSGREIWQQMQSLGTAIAERFAVPAGDQVEMIFGSVEQIGPVEAHETVAGQPRSCLQIDHAARQGVEGRAVLGDDDQPAARTVQLRAGAAANDFVVPVNWGRANPDAPLRDEPANAAAAQMVSGLLLLNLRYGSATAATVQAQFDPRNRTRLPLSVAGERGQTIPLPAAKTGGTEAAPEFTLRLRNARANIAFNYDYLSPGTITQVSLNANGGLDWVGQIRPSVPLLPRQLDVIHENESLRLRTALDQRQLRSLSPIPGFRLTEGNIDLILAPELGVQGSLAFVLGTGSRPLASGRVTVGVDSGGLFATGTLVANVPGVDEASGELHYRNGAWTARIVIETSQINLPYVERGRLQLDIDRSGLSPSGEVELSFPRNLGQATLGVRRRAAVLEFFGRGRLRVPRLREVTVDVLYDGTQLTASAQNIGFEWRGFDGTVNVTYTARRGQGGQVTGNGRLALRRGDIVGSVEVTLHDSGNFSGRGQVTYPFTIRGRRVEATATITVSEDQRVRVEGAMRLPQPVELFRRFGDNRRLFAIDREIPIPGASIGPVGLQAVIRGSVSARYGFGPGELRNVQLTAGFNPLEADPNPTVTFNADLHIPASAGISGTIGGGLAVSVGVASVDGTLNVTASLDLNATLGGNLALRYENRRFEMRARPGINASLDLGLSLDAMARARAGIGPFSVGVEKTWNLGRRQVTLGAFSLHAPISYSSDGGFTAPSMDQLEWGPMPEFNASDIMRQLFSGASQRERET